MIRLVVATHNAHKTGEIRAMLAGVAEVEDLAAHPDIPPADETGDTFEANATLKALAASRRLPDDSLVLADDSGLEVDALAGAPGVRSARYAGEDADDAANRRKLLAELNAAGAKGKARSARFQCALVVARAGEKLAAFHGTVEGLIGTVEKGDGGFGYDPLFIPEGRCETFAQVSPETKNAMSHRARALAKLVAFLRDGIPRR